ncbi:Uncharacterised protein [Mycobacteroides abscessus]|nr:Uncharacterised protein [Mycobacteroides abscessus]
MTTLRASRRRAATSSALTSRCSPCGPSPPAGAAPSSAPKPPRMTDTNDRFMARHMM